MSVCVYIYTGGRSGEKEDKCKKREKRKKNTSECASCLGSAQHGRASINLHAKDGIPNLQLHFECGGLSFAFVNL